jgi:hypothetical protein
MRSSHSNERTDIRRTDDHYSWRDVYALCGVDPDASGSTTSTATTGRGDANHDRDADSQVNQ